MAKAQRAMAAAAILWQIVASAACTDSGNGYELARDGGNEAGAASPFTEVELGVIRLELGTLPPLPNDPTNAYFDDARAAALGQKLFFEARYSQNRAISCATCHIPEHGFQDNRGNVSQGIGFTSRHTGTILNAAYGSAGPVAVDASAAGPTDWQGWDGSRDSLWAQALWSSEDPIQMGGTRSRIALLLYDKYRSEYEAVFNQMPPMRDDSGNPIAPDDASPGAASWDRLNPAVSHEITQIFVNFGKAIGAYEGKIVSRDSRFDQFYQEIGAGAVRSDHLTPDEIQGLKIFVGKGGCISCHWGPNFSNWEFYDTGVAQMGDHVPLEDSGRAGGIARALRGEFNCASAWSDRPGACWANSITLADAGDEAGTNEGIDIDAVQGAFKVPTLRGVSSTSPYFHTGAATTLSDVVQFYDRGGDVHDDDAGVDGGAVRKLDPNVRVLDLTDEEKTWLVAFLHALDGAALDSSLTTAPTLPE